jgi:hypothetical protein
MAAVETRSSVVERLNALAEDFAKRLCEPRLAAAEYVSYFSERASALSALAREVDEEYVPLTQDGEVPTVAQGVALARFLRPAFRDKCTGAFVCRAGHGTPEDYVFVRLTDGYEGGIAPDGRTST